LGWKNQESLFPGGERQFQLTVDAAETRYIIARLGLDGPVLAAVPVTGFRIFSSSEVYLRQIEIYEDGSQLVEMGIVFSPVLQQVSLKLQIIVGGILFDDGTISREITASDFNGLGQAAIRFIRPANAATSVCHTIDAYQGTTYLGTH
jgi:hypothetical protein